MRKHSPEIFSTYLRHHLPLADHQRAAVPAGGRGPLPLLLPRLRRQHCLCGARRAGDTGTDLCQVPGYETAGD